VVVSLTFPPRNSHRPPSFRATFAAMSNVSAKSSKLDMPAIPGEFESVSERADFDSQYYAARNWLVERWGEQHACPICGNVEWTLSGVAPAIRPTGFLSFHATCDYCGNTVHVVPGRATKDSPRRIDSQLELPGQ